MTISVIIPCHNCGPWIQDALHSVASQTLPAYEILVIDDASTDDTVRQLTDSNMRLKVVRTEYKNAAAARNHGIQLANGDWIAFLDGDDMWYPNHLSAAKQHLQKSADTVYLSHYDRLVSNKTLLPVIPMPGAATKYNLDHNTFYEWYVRPNPGWTTVGMVIRRSRLMEIGGFDKSLVRRHDADLFGRAVYDQTWTYNSTPTWCYRQGHSGRISNSLVECAYYLLMAQLKNESVYFGPEMNTIICQQARSAMSYAAQAGRSDIMKSIWDVARDRFGTMHKWLYSIGRVTPTGLGGILRLRHRLSFMGIDPVER